MKKLSKNKKIFVNGFLISLTIVHLYGCLPIPVPPQPRDARTYPPINFQRNISEDTTSKIITGFTSRKDVLLMLGEPDFYDNQNKKFIYKGEITPGGKNLGIILITPIGPGYGTVTPFDYEGYRLTIIFDDRGLVKQRKFELLKKPDE